MKPLDKLLLAAIFPLGFCLAWIQCGWEIATGKAVWNDDGYDGYQWDVPNERTP